MNILTLSSLVKVFSDEKPCAKQYDYFSMLKKEKLNFQIAVETEEDAELNVSAKSENELNINVYEIRNVPVQLASGEGSDDFFLRTEPGLYPDLLVPVKERVKFSKNEWKSIWFEVSCRKAGKYPVCITVGSEKAEVTVEVMDCELPEQELVCTNWYHSDGICHYYGVEAMSEEFWRITENFIRTAAEHGVNCLLTPLFTPPLDTQIDGERRTIQLVDVTRTAEGYSFNLDKLDRWIDLCHKCGIKYFEMNHFFTQWGALHAPKVVATMPDGSVERIFGWDTPTDSSEYNDFLTALSKVLIPFIDEKGIRDYTIFHVSDEPGEKDFDTYMMRAEFIEKTFPGFKVIDALSDFEFYSRGAVKTPVPCENRIEDFFGNVPELWTYYCCGQRYEYVPNRLIAMPSMRNRVLGTLMYKYDIKGFLQWGYNFYNTQYSIDEINPYEVTDAGAAFPAGDPFVVYPGENGEVISSLRFKVFYDGIQDLRALKALEKKEGRAVVLGLIGEITFKDYPHEDEYLLELREIVNKKLGG